MNVRVPAPVVSAAVSGFVVGVLVTLAAVGVFTHATPSAATPPATLPPATPESKTSVKSSVTTLVSKVLGPSYPNPANKRLLSVHLSPADPDIPLHPEPRIARQYDRYHSVILVIRLNDHPLGPAWRAKSARSDVFQVMKGLYTSRLPIFNTEIVGMFPLRAGKKMRLQPVLFAFLDHATASTLPWKRFKRTDEGRFWTLLTYRYINSRFGKLP